MAKILQGAVLKGMPFERLITLDGHFMLVKSSSFVQEFPTKEKSHRVKDVVAFKF